jgi:glycosyltransferase involved in cell wall biosynthesis
VQLLGLRNDIPDLLAAADGWVMPSLSEGLPMALLEALFARLPVVCTAVGGIPSLVEQGNTGWLVPPADPDQLASALEELVTQPTLRARMGEQALLNVEQEYGQMRMVDRYLDLYQWKEERIA